MSHIFRFFFITMMIIALPVTALADTLEFRAIEDTYIEGSTILGNNDNIHGHETILNASRNTHLWSETLIKATNLFGDDVMQLNDDSVILSAELHLWLDWSWEADANTWSLYQLASDWNEDTVTSNSFGRVQANALPTPVDAVPGRTETDHNDAEYVFDVTSSLLAWQAGALNYGWGLTASGPLNHFFSSEADDLNRRPYLIVNYDSPSNVPVPEPSTLLLFGTTLAGMIVARRKFRQ